jgi:hypothetical protein
MMLIDIQLKESVSKNPRIVEFVIIVLEQAWRKLGTILWHDSVIFGKNFSDGRILSAILLESRSKSSHLSRRAREEAPCLCHQLFHPRPVEVALCCRR